MTNNPQNKKSLFVFLGITVIIPLTTNTAGDKLTPKWITFNFYPSKIHLYFKQVLKIFQERK
jgi:hypothetical protein